MSEAPTKNTNRRKMGRGCFFGILALLPICGVFIFVFTRPDIRVAITPIILWETTDSDAGFSINHPHSWQIQTFAGELPSGLEYLMGASNSIEGGFYQFSVPDEYAKVIISRLPIDQYENAANAADLALVNYQNADIRQRSTRLDGRDAIEVIIKNDEAFAVVDMIWVEEGEYIYTIEGFVYAFPDKTTVSFYHNIIGKIIQSFNFSI